jgi:hypothetical protein
MHDDRGSGALLKWLALAVPGLFAGLGWSAASGNPTWIRLLCGVAAGATIYALLHLLLKRTDRDRN